MPTSAASGSGEPPTTSDYCGKDTLPRSGLLEPGVEADASRDEHFRSAELTTHAWPPLNYALHAWPPLNYALD